MSAAPLPRQDTQFTTGEMVLVSSDNVSFKVGPLPVLAASSVLRDAWDMNKTASPHKPLAFADPDFETADVVRLFLQLVTTGVFSESVSGDMALRLVRFLRKYDCTLTMNHLAVYLFASCQDIAAVLVAFAIAARADNVQLAESILKRWQPQPILKAMSYHSFTMLPSAYSWALSFGILHQSADAFHQRLQEAKRLMNGST